ncbi:MAG: hypothetical protein KAY65_13695, partial [Planctomycetes bacterium]|nr:hypothetical protein [Planctomycetota bacterium]
MTPAAYLPGQEVRPRVHTERPEIGLFSSVGAYNQHTTVQPIIYQFRKNAHLISAAISAIYKTMQKLYSVFNGRYRTTVGKLSWSVILLFSKLLH